VALSTAYACPSADSNLDRFREITAVIDRRTFNEASLHANPDSRAFAILGFEVRAIDISSATSKTLRSLFFAICKSTVNKVSEYII
jgi:hypothetical protein